MLSQLYQASGEFVIRIRGSVWTWAGEQGRHIPDQYAQRVDLFDIEILPSRTGGSEIRIVPAFDLGGLEKYVESRVAEKFGKPNLGPVTDFIDCKSPPITAARRLCDFLDAELPETEADGPPIIHDTMWGEEQGFYLCLPIAREDIADLAVGPGARLADARASRGGIPSLPELLLAEVTADEPETSRDSGRFAYAREARQKIVKEYRELRATGSITNKDAWATANHGISGNTVLNYEREFPEERKEET